MDQMINDYNSEQLKRDVPEFHVGDTVRVSTRIVEGEKERVQVFQGTVIFLCTVFLTVREWSVFFLCIARESLRLRL